MVRQQASTYKDDLLDWMYEVLEVSQEHLTSREVGTETFIYKQSFGQQVSSSLPTLQGKDPMEPMVNMQARASTPWSYNIWWLVLE